jgi:hypothetical protein
VAVSRLYATDKTLPASLDALLRYNSGLRIRDPATNRNYEYVPAAGSEFQLCATFAQEGSPSSGERMQTSIFGFHTAGRQCFHVDALKTNLYR